MKKKRSIHLITILSLTFVSLIFLFSIYQTNKSLTGFTIYESPEDGTTINDTYIREDSGSNYGTETTLRLGKIVSGLEYRSLIKFNVSSISSENTIVTSNLQVYVESSSGDANRTINAYRLISDWQEIQANWSHRTTGNLWDSIGGDYLQELDSVYFENESGNYYNFSITTATRGWVNGTYENYGIIIFSNDSEAGNLTYLSSSNSATASQRPKIIIDYTENAIPIIDSITTDSLLSSPTTIGETVNFTIQWTDLESNPGQLFVCALGNINTTGCEQTTFCNTSFQSTDPSSCVYTTQSSNNRTTEFSVAVCDAANCSAISNSSFYVNHKPTALIVHPNGGETVNQTQGNYNVTFNVSDADADFLTADLYYGSTQNSTTYSIASNINLTANCTDLDSNISTTNNCSYSWNSGGIYGTYFLTIIINDSYITSNDSSDSSFNIRSIIDNLPPQITAQATESTIFSGKSTQIYANITEENINQAWASFNYTSANTTLTNTTDTEYSGTFTAPAVGTYKFKVYARDKVGNLNDTSDWQEFTVTKPIAVAQNSLAPSSALPYSTIKITGDINATNPLQGVYAYLTVPNGFTFVSNYSQNYYIGTVSANQTKTATWFVSVPITEATYTLNITYTDAYSNQYTSSNMNIQVTSAIGGGYFISVTGYPEVETSDDYFAEASFTQSGTYTSADSATINIYDSTGSLIVGPASMENPSTGIYNYTYTVGASASEGQWETIINATKSSTSYYANHFWNVVGGPFDVRDITILNSTIQGLNISVVTENTGGANKDLTLNWNLTRVDNNALLDSGSDTFMVSANSERTWSVTPTTDYVGQVKITFLGYYSGTEKAGAYETFSTTSNATTPITPPTPPPSGSGGGGGTTTIQKTDLEITADEIINLAKNLEKTIKLKIKNTGDKTINNIFLTLDGLDKNIYSISPEKIDSLKSGDTKEFEIRLFTSDLIGEQDFNYQIKSDELTKTKQGKLIITNMKEYLLNELARLKQKHENVKNKITQEELLNELKNCENIIIKLELEIEKEEFINAKDNIIEADKCIDSVEDKIKPDKKPIQINMQEYTVWIITWTLLLILIIALGFIIYFLYRKFSVLTMLKTQQQNTSEKKTTSRKPFLDEKIKSIEEKLGR